MDYQKIVRKLKDLSVEFAVGGKTRLELANVLEKLAEEIESMEEDMTSGE